MENTLTASSSREAPVTTPCDVTAARNVTAAMDGPFSKNGVNKEHLTHRHALWGVEPLIEFSCQS